MAQQNGILNGVVAALIVAGGVAAYKAGLFGSAGASITALLSGNKAATAAAQQSGYYAGVLAQQGYDNAAAPAAALPVLAVSHDPAVDAPALVPSHDPAADLRRGLFLMGQDTGAAPVPIADHPVIDMVGAFDLMNSGGY